MSKDNKAVAVGAPAPLLVDIKQAAAMLNTTIWQIRELGWAKKLPVIRLGRKWLFRPADLEAFVKRAA
jgi:excisionase family DNA binding protein